MQNIQSVLTFIELIFSILRCKVLYWYLNWYLSFWQRKSTEFKYPITCSSACWFLFFFLFQDGGRGHLEGLASVYCEMLMAPFGEVLMALEEARQRAWSNRSPRHRSGMNKGHRGSCNQIDSLPNSHSQPIYVPGKYSVRYKYNKISFWHLLH